MRRKMAAGNWKMNGLGENLNEIMALTEAHPAPGCDVLICPPATLIAAAAAQNGPVAVGGQDCHPKTSGAHTGDLSAQMLADAGASYVILGHSERREDHGETDALIAAKTQAALAAGLTAVVCVGESLETREAGTTLDVVGAQLMGSLPGDITAETCVVAYEPIWAIGTGKVPSLEEIAEVHDFLRRALTERFGEETAQGIRLLYGGSVKPSNATEIFATSNVDGALVGGASLKAQDFSAIITALEAA
ncbi:triose-phosphate isomerase [Roseobacteraceae bacterium S113]